MGARSLRWTATRGLVRKCDVPGGSTDEPVGVSDVDLFALSACGDELKPIAENESTYTPIGVKHRRANPGKMPLYLIEVQSGGYLGEDDIV